MGESVGVEAVGLWVGTLVVGSWVGEPDGELVVGAELGGLVVGLVVGELVVGGVVVGEDDCDGEVVGDTVGAQVSLRQQLVLHELRTPSLLSCTMTPHMYYNLRADVVSGGWCGVPRDAAPRRPGERHAVLLPARG